MAPSSSASLRRLSCGSNTMIVSQPWTTPPTTPASPADPAPITSSEEPGCAAIELITAPAPVWIPQPSRPTSSSRASSGSLTTLCTLASARVAKEDWPKKAACTGPSGPVTVGLPSGRTPA